MISLLVLVLGCAMTPERFAEASVEGICEWGFTCADRTFSAFEDMDACVEAQEPWATPWYACYEAHCGVFDPAAARACLDDVDLSDCDALAPAACAEVWTDCDTAALTECQALATAG